MTCNDAYCACQRQYLQTKTDIDIRNFLDKTSMRHKVFHHFTTMKALAQILSSKQWRLSSAAATNDLQEWDEKGIREEWNKIFSASFTHGYGENIGMWKMYGSKNPNKQICISFTVDFIKSWINQIKVVKINDRVFHIDNDGIMNDQKVSPITFHDVIYAHGKQYDPEMRICWGNIIKKCNQFEPSQSSVLTGYIKNAAWEYEKETRLMIKLPLSDFGYNDEPPQHIFIDFPLIDEFKSIHYTFSPFADKCEEKLKEILKSELDKERIPKDIIQSIISNSKMSYFYEKINL